MIKPCAPQTLPRAAGPLAWVAAVCIMAVGLSANPAHAQDPSPLAQLEALGLDTVTVGRVTAHFAAADREYAHRLATLSESAAAYFEREFGASFPLRLAVLSPDDWFDPYPGGGSLPYGMPWAWVEDLLMTTPASLDEGVLIAGPNVEADRRRVQFVLLHEFGHLATKQHLHPESPHPYSMVRWFEEFLATYFAYSYVRTYDPEWAESSRREWAEFVEGYSPAVLSLDWAFMRELPPEEYARTYAWYQNLLNLQVADVYEEHGLDFLRAVRGRMSWEHSEAWTNESLLRSLEGIAPGFEAWASDLQRRDHPQSIDD